MAVWPSEMEVGAPHLTTAARERCRRRAGIRASLLHRHSQIRRPVSLALRQAAALDGGTRHVPLQDSSGAHHHKPSGRTASAAAVRAARRSVSGAGLPATAVLQ